MGDTINCGNAGGPRKPARNSKPFAISPAMACNRAVGFGSCAGIGGMPLRIDPPPMPRGPQVGVGSGAAIGVSGAGARRANSTCLFPNNSTVRLPRDAFTDSYLPKLNPAVRTGALVTRRMMRWPPSCRSSFKSPANTICRFAG